MASIRKRGIKWQVQVRRKNCPPVTRSFINRRDAEVWARQKESHIDRTGLPQDTESLETQMLADLVSRYRGTELTRKRSGDRELEFLTAFLRHPICSKRLSELTTADFAAYRDERLQEIKGLLEASARSHKQYV